MYIASKWLITLSLGMWVAICSVNFIVDKTGKVLSQDSALALDGLDYKNKTLRRFLSKNDAVNIFHEKREFGMALHYMTFAAGALVVFLYNKKKEIVLYTKVRLTKANLISTFLTTQDYLRESLKETAKVVCVAIYNFGTNCWKIVLERNTFLKSMFVIKKANRYPFNFDILMIQKIKDATEELKNTKSLLVAAVRLNKHIRAQLQLERMAKNRLVRCIEETKSYLKESRTKYTNIHNQYLLTHQDNLFLKSRIYRLTAERDELEVNLKDVINKIYNSKNIDLMSYCNNFNVQSNGKFQKADVRQEVNKFLGSSRNSLSVSSCTDLQPVSTRTQLRPKSSCSSRSAREFQPDRINLFSEVPKLKGLPGECCKVILKDKNGMIEKLYEYDCDTHLNNGDMIRRIREYSVYCDRDCLLDYNRSRTIITQRTSDSSKMNINYPPTNRKFLTNSKEFQNFLKNNRNCVAYSLRGQAPTLQCG